MFCRAVCAFTLALLRAASWMATAAAEVACRLAASCSSWRRWSLAASRAKVFSRATMSARMGLRRTSAELDVRHDVGQDGIAAHVQFGGAHVHLGLQERVAGLFFLGLIVGLRLDDLLFGLRQI